MAELIGQLGKLLDRFRPTGSSYFEEKAQGVDFQRLSMLPFELQTALIDGPIGGMRAALAKARQFERDNKKTILTDAVMVLVNEERERRGSNRKDNQPLPVG